MTISVAAPAMTDAATAERERRLGSPSMAAAFDASGGVRVVLAALEEEEDTDTDTDGVVSPSELDAFPRIELANAHTERMLFTSEGRLGVSSTAVWFVFSKQSTHCGKTDWKVSVQEHLITSMNAPGLKRTEVTLARTVAAWAQELMLE